MSKERYIWLDIARGICILLMVFCHSSANGSKILSAINGYTGVFFLVFFFVSAGYCFNEKKAIKEYITVQVKKCIVPYCIISIFYLCYLFRHHSIPGIDFAHKVLNAGSSLIWGLANTFAIGPIQTIGMGPIWFMVVFFMSTVFFKIFGRKKNFGWIIIILAIIASISQSFVVLPFTIQNAFIGCMFVWIGYIVKKKWRNRIKNIYELNTFKLTIVLLTIIIGVWVSKNLGYELASRTSGVFLDLGSNNYSVFSLPASLFGIALVVVLAILIERTKVLDEFLAFCGRESFYILIIHDIDITMLRSFTNRDNTFIAFTLLLYPFLIYLYRRFEKIIKK